jgi:hypothetical protein
MRECYHFNDNKLQILHLNTKKKGQLTMQISLIVLCPPQFVRILRENDNILN